MDVYESEIGPHKSTHELKEDDARKYCPAEELARPAVVLPKVLISYEKPEKHQVERMAVWGRES